MVSKLPCAPSSNGSRLCKRSLRIVTTAAPSSAPGMCAAPPITAISKYSMLASRPNGVGFTARWKLAYSQPASPASIAAWRKASIRAHGVRTPNDAAATAPPRSARTERPTRLSSRLRVASIARATQTHTRTK